MGKDNRGGRGKSVSLVFIVRLGVVAVTVLLIFAGCGHDPGESPASPLPIQELYSGSGGGDIALEQLDGGDEAPPSPYESTDSIQTAVSPDVSAEPSDHPKESESPKPEAASQESRTPGETPEPEDTLSPSPQTPPSQTQAPDDPQTSVDPNIPVINEYGIYSRGALLLDLETGETVFAYKEKEIFYPASLVKMMTAILAIEMIPDLDKEITITFDMLKGLYEAGASQVGFLEGEQVRAIDLLYGVMVPSGADASNAVAVAAAGSIDEFVSLMNSKAKTLGLSDTVFVNVHGLHDENQISTATDLAALLRYCLNNETFREIFTTTIHTIPPTDLHPDGITIQNNLMRALRNSDLEGKENVLGSKNGFTTPAGQCLASLGKVNGREYILITLNAGKNGYNYERYNMLDAVYLYSAIK